MAESRELRVLPAQVLFVLSRAVLAVVATVILISGCTHAPSRPLVAIPSDLNQLEQWQARGRIGVSSAAGGGSGSFQWQQRGDRADVEIRGPVGIGSVRLQVQGDAQDPHVTLETSDGVKLESQAAWDELETRLGAQVPAGRLRFWMLGIAAPGDHLWQGAAEQDAKILEQDGWRIDYQQYSDEPGAHVPVRMRASSGDTRVRIVVDRWQLGQ
ncbi:outer membrane lipoprotein LolB [Povalibacter uvarum]|uniref:Outer-membrane lipoprotein LolB n=1 Tax=Povalibacter uvarum TaxID=732238 RepID=A0A841HSJ1_9GAMM|nr:lipoprotein insertase outer membrane protein LolB [Povalibacter uvarum]MBB6095856.1 outer membrane lipoprotein LolB [Povalibacter uvarum]